MVLLSKSQTEMRITHLTHIIHMAIDTASVVFHKDLISIDCMHVFQFMKN